MNKIELKSKIVDSLKGQEEIERIIIFGSFNRSDSPNDIDIAVVQNSSKNYLTLALKYRKLIRKVSKEITVDIFPIVEKNDNSFFFKRSCKRGSDLCKRKLKAGLHILKKILKLPKSYLQVNFSIPACKAFSNQ